MASLPKRRSDREWREQLRQVTSSRDQLRRDRAELRQRLQQVEAERDRLQRQVKQQDRQIQKLKAQLEEARRAAKRQAAPFGRRQRKKDPRGPGQKPGHKAAHRERPPQVDHRVRVPLCACPDCGGAVRDVQDLEPQIVIEVPEPIKPQVTEYTNQSGWCGRCRKRVQSRHPGQHSRGRGAAGVQVGPRTLALAMDLRHRVGIVYRKVAGVLELLLGIRVCAATLVRAAHRIAKRCEPSCQVLVEELREAQVAHGDETGWCLTAATQRPWLWVFASVQPAITVYVVRPSRGHEVVQEVLGEEFAGVLVVDGWGAYVSLPCAKAQCYAHLLRRCAELLEVQKRGAARVPHAVRRILKDAMELGQLRPLMSPQDYWAAVEQVRGQMRAVLEGRIEEPANRRLVKHLSRHEDQLWTFLALEGVAPTNNLAEQEVRPGVLLRKLSAGNRTQQGAHTYEVLATVSRTAVRNGLVLADVLPELLRSSDPDAVLPLLTAGPPVCTHLSESLHGRAQGPVRSAGTQLRRPGRGLGHGVRKKARPPPAA